MEKDLFRSRDFYMKNIYNEKGKKLGVIKDLFIDIKEEKVIGFEVSNYSLFRKRNFLDIIDIKTINENVIATKLKCGKYKRFSDYKDMEVVDKNNNIKGDILDILFEEDDFIIKGILISPGILEKIIKGKEVILIKDISFKEGKVVYYGDKTIVFKNIPRKSINNEYTKNQ